MAIAFDTTTRSSATSASTLTFSHTCTGSNLILWVQAGCSAGTNTNITGVTYNGVAMTSVGSVSNGANEKLFYLIAPATGAHNVIISANGTGSITGSSASYTGVKQSGVPDASGTAGPTTTTSYSQSVTTVADNCWAIMSGNAAGGAAFTAGSNTTVRQQVEAVIQGSFLLDTNGVKTPPGTDTMAVTSTSQPIASIMASFAPFTTQNLTLIAAQGAYALTGQSATLSKAWKALTAVFGSYILTGFAANLKNNQIWTKISKSSTPTYTKQTKNTTSWTNISKS